MASRIITILLFNLAFSALTLTAPLKLAGQSSQATGSDRSRRQTQGAPVPVASVMTASGTNSGTESCPVYGDESCGNIQDMLCSAQTFQDEYNRRTVCG